MEYTSFASAVSAIMDAAGSGIMFVVVAVVVWKTISYLGRI